jgi:hypothetical protein
MIFADERAGFLHQDAHCHRKNKFYIEKKVFVTEKCSNRLLLDRTRNPYKNMFYLVSVVVLVALQTG